jgi:hypothetical protein
MYIKHPLPFTERLVLQQASVVAKSDLLCYGWWHSIDLSFNTGGDISSIYNSPIIGLLNYCSSVLCISVFLILRMVVFHKNNK